MGLYLIMYFTFYQYIVPHGTVPNGRYIGSIKSNLQKHKSCRDVINTMNLLISSLITRRIDLLYSCSFKQEFSKFAPVC